jgi:hypothetical protein
MSHSRRPLSSLEARGNKRLLVNGNKTIEGRMAFASLLIRNDFPQRKLVMHGFFCVSRNPKQPLDEKHAMETPLMLQEIKNSNSTRKQARYEFLHVAGNSK